MSHDHAIPTRGTRLPKLLKSLLKAILTPRMADLLGRVVAYDSRLALYRNRLTDYLDANATEACHDVEFCLAMLRMHAHVLDKALNRGDWEPGHSQSLYREAKRFSSLCRDVDDPTYEWANAILLEYEKRSADVCSDIDRADHRPRVWRGPSSCPPVGPEELMRHLKYRTSIRCFQPRRIAKKDALAIAEAGLEAPSSCHRQTLRIYGSVEPDLVQKIGSCFHGFTGFSAFVPMLLVFCSDLRPYSYPPELFTPTLDTGLALQNCVLMASSFGISVTILNWTGRSGPEQRLRSCLGIPDYEAIVAGAAGGYASGAAARPVRKPVSKTLVLR